MDEQLMTSSDFPTELLPVVNSLYKRQLLCDITLVIGGYVEFHLHKVMLVSGSGYFKTLLDQGMLFVNRYDLPGLNPTHVNQLLDFLYTGSMMLNKSNVWGVKNTAEQLDIQAAKKLCEEYVRKTTEGPVFPQQAVLTESAAVSDVEQRKSSIAKIIEMSVASTQTTQEYPSIPFSGQPQPSSPQSSHPPRSDLTPKSKIAIKQEVFSEAEPDMNDTYNEQDHFSDNDWMPLSDLTPVEPVKSKRKRGRPRKVDQQAEFEMVSHYTGKKSKGSSKAKPKLKTLKIKIKKLDENIKPKYKQWDKLPQIQFLKPKPLPRPFMCSYCDKGFPHAATVKLHIQQEHKFVYRQSVRCRLLLARALRQTQVALAVSEGPPPKCNICLGAFAYHTSLKQHCTKVHRRLVKCTKCPKLPTFMSFFHLKVHEHLKHKEIPKKSRTRRERGRKRSKPHYYKCYFCPHRTLNEKVLAVHISQRHSEIMLKPFPCKYCKKSFSDKKYMKDHMKGIHYVPDNLADKWSEKVNQHFKTPFVCTECHELFTKRTKLRSHLAANHGIAQIPAYDGTEKPYKCNDCPKTFLKRQHLGVHRREIHGVDFNGISGGQKCEEAGCVFECIGKTNLKEHYKDCHPDVMHSCQRCPYTSCLESQVTNHMTRKHQIRMKAYSCTMCNKTFSSKYHVKHHEFSLHGIESEDLQVFECPEPGCNYKTPQKYTLKKHAQKHMPGKMFTCLECGKKLKTELYLEKHMNKIHRGIRPYMCDQCGASYGEEAELKTHMARHGAKTHVCSHCGYATADKGNYQSHMFALHHIVLSQTMIIFECEICGFACERRQRFEDHQRSHRGIKEYSCDICGQMFISIRTLRKHKKWKHTPKNLTCDFCNYVTNDTTHLKDHVKIMHTHRNHKPYKCFYCNFVCATSGNCRKHCMNRHKNEEVRWIKITDKTQESLESSIVIKPSGSFSGGRSSIFPIGEEDNEVKSMVKGNDIQKNQENMTMAIDSIGLKVGDSFSAEKPSVITHDDDPSLASTNRIPSPPLQAPGMSGSNWHYMQRPHSWHKT
ncbi:unnamed protein product [Owenia fusiformis]|uniref:Uncharacterized protein n=1 Tax=Owenia fusiformis TaxID=6347 RepID=A0A8S4MUR0_OWEFU|nr:unnamed protein product [Owenia fusiformis]